MRAVGCRNLTRPSNAAAKSTSASVGNSAGCAQAWLPSRSGTGAKASAAAAPSTAPPRSQRLCRSSFNEMHSAISPPDSASAPRPLRSRAAPRLCVAFDTMAMATAASSNVAAAVPARRPLCQRSSPVLVMAARVGIAMAKANSSNWPSTASASPKLGRAAASSSGHHTAAAVRPRAIKRMCRSQARSSRRAIAASAEASHSNAAQGVIATSAVSSNCRVPVMLQFCCACHRALPKCA